MHGKIIYLFIFCFVQTNLISAQKANVDSLILGKWNLEYKNRKREKIDWYEAKDYEFYSENRYYKSLNGHRYNGMWKINRRGKKLKLHETYYTGGDIITSIPDPNDLSQPYIIKGGPLMANVELYKFKIVSINKNELVLKDTKRKRYYFIKEKQ